jgi:hypothetical protein
MGVVVMKTWRMFRIGTLAKAALSCAALAVFCLPVSAQGGGGGGGGTTTGGAGGAKAGGTTGGGGTGTTGNTSSVFGSSGTGSSNAKTSGTGTTPITASNPFKTYYASPYSAGLGSNVTLASQNGLSFDTGGAKSSTLVTGRGTFGVPMYAATTTTGGGRGGAAGGAGGLTSTTNAVAGFSTQGIKRAPAYVTTIDFQTVPALPMTQKLGDFKSNLQNSSMLPNGKNLNVFVENQSTVVLQGTVGTERERRLAESIIRLEPGVRDVRNEIQVVENK